MFYPYVDFSWLLKVLLIALLPLLVLFVLELISAAMQPTEDPRWIAGQRLARGEIDKAQLHVLLNAL